MWVRVEEMGAGQHPSEVVVGVRVSDGSVARLIVDRRSIDNNAIEVGFPVGSDKDRFLVELPRETSRGEWRVWLKQSDLLQGVPA